MIAQLIEQFDKSVEKANRLEEKLIANTESDYERRIRDAEEKEHNKAKDAIGQAEKLINEAEKRYEKTLQKIESSDLSPELRLAAQQAKDAEIAAIRAKLADGIGNAKAELKEAISLARVTRAEALELVKVDRAGDKLSVKVSKVGDQYLSKLQKAGASQAVLDQAAIDRAKALADAETKVKTAQATAVLDDIARVTGQITEEHGRRWRSDYRGGERGRGNFNRGDRGSFNRGDRGNFNRGNRGDFNRGDRGDNERGKRR